jgi:amino acid transporter
LCQDAIGWLGIVLCWDDHHGADGDCRRAGEFQSVADRAAAKRLPTTSSSHWGLGGAMLIAIYDYLGYYNVCHMGDEVREPERTIPRAVMGSVVLVALIYLTMNIAIIGVVPWQEAMQSDNIAAAFMERLFGSHVAATFCS